MIFQLLHFRLTQLIIKDITTSETIISPLHGSSQMFITSVSQTFYSVMASGALGGGQPRLSVVEFTLEKII